MSEDRTKYLELAKKLKALADGSPVAGEKHNAKRQLDRIMRAHGISASELEELEKNLVEFNFNSHLTWLWVQVVVSVVGKGVESRRRKGKRGQVYLMVTKAQQIEIEAKFEFYAKAFKEEVGILKMAFVQRYSIYDENARATDGSELSEEQRQKYIRAMEVVEILPDRPFLRGLE